MSAGKHTPGPLRVVDGSATNHCCFYESLVCDVFEARDLEKKYPLVVCEVLTDTDGHRLAAAWNACEGIPTEAIDAGVISGMLEALEEYLPILKFLEESGLWDDAAHGTGLATANKYRAAIAKAKGGDA